MSLHLYTSNRMEALVDGLATKLSRPLASPFGEEEIVVQSKGMQRWLSMELALRLGIFANARFPFPNLMVAGLFQKMFSELPSSSPFSKEVMSWRVMALLPELLDREPFGPLRHYLDRDHDGLRSFQLAQKIADTFDQYTLYRSEMLLGWEAAEAGSLAGGWQAVLWRKLVSSTTGVHRGRLRERFCRQAAAAKTAPSWIPERITVFGISYLPALHLSILSAVSRLTEVNLFFLSPSREYWADILSKKASARLPAPERELRSEGNPLLALLGSIGRDFSDMIVDFSDEALEEEDLYRDPGTGSLLHTLQSDMLNLQGTGEEGVLTLAPSDRSIRINSCHSPLREIEVLHDTLLAMLEEQSGLTPREIVVMTPDIESYAPYISSVFGAGANGGVALPYTIADRRLMNEGEIAAGLLALLDLGGSRLGAPELFDFLIAPPVSRRFGLSESDLFTIRGWIEQTRVRWGMDEGDRVQRGLPSYRENSWRAGLERLLLGYAMPDEGELFQGVLPYDALEGSMAATLGVFAEFLDLIEAFMQSLQKPRRLEGWRHYFLGLLDDFFVPAESSEREWAAIREVIDQIGKLALEAEFTAEVEPAVILAWLKGRLEQEEQGLGFMTGGITFCAMLPMRSIPFRVVALIGMNDTAFPRQSRPPGFDLISLEPKRGDRSLRNEDRYLFLESIISARDVLYISYLGQSIRDNSELPPSVLVSELLDAIQRRFVLPSGASLQEHLVVRHRLQPFNQEYFSTNSRLFSYSEENYQALLQQEQGAGQAIRPFMESPLSELPDEWKEVPLQRLLRFYDNPAAFFLEHRLGIRLEGAAQPLTDREPFALEGLERYAMQQELLEVVLRGGEAEMMLPLFRSRGVLPPARQGELAFLSTLDEVRKFALKVQEKTASTGGLPPLEADIQLGGFRLTGQLEGVWPEGMLRYRCAELKERDQIRCWIEHLVLNTIAPAGYGRRSTLVMRNRSVQYSEVENASALLEQLLNRYWQGLLMPLRFFPRSSMAYAVKEELKAAAAAWQDGYNNFRGEGSEPAIRRCFGAGDPFDSEFCTIALELLKPMMQAGGRG